MATKKAPPRRNTDVIRCENCGEEYSTTYKRGPFCDERPSSRSYPPVGGGRRVAGGTRSSRSGRQPNPLQVAGLVISLVLIIAAVVIVFTTLSPLLFGSTPSGSNGGTSVSTSAGNVTLESLTLSRTDEDQVTLQAGESFQLTVTTVPEDAQVTVEWTSSNENIATVDEYGNITNVYKGSDQVSVTITASAGGQTAFCAILCTGDGTGENIDTSGDTGSGTTTSGTTLDPGPQHRRGDHRRGRRRTEYPLRPGDGLLRPGQHLGRRHRHRAGGGGQRLVPHPLCHRRRQL